MIEITNTNVHGWYEAIRGMRNPMNSWDKSDSEFHYDLNRFSMGSNDHELMMKLVGAGSEHAKFRRMIIVSMDILAPLYWWKEFDTYKIGTVANSCSTMHKIHAKEFTVDDFSHEHLSESSLFQLKNIIKYLNDARELFIKTKNRAYWWQMIQLLPSSYNQKRTISLNYEVLANIYYQRKGHKLNEWNDFCAYIKGLPYSELIIGKEPVVIELTIERNDLYETY